MRPGQLTPENTSESEQSTYMTKGFNEAGAINPGKRESGDPGEDWFRELQ